MLSLNSIPSFVISIPGKRRRRKYITAHFAEIGIDFEFVDGVSDVGKIRGCAQSHAKAFDASKSTPFLVFEDDVALNWELPVLPQIPSDADAVYLGTNTAGCMPNRIENKEQFGHRSISGLALASEHDKNYLRLHSMVSAHAVLFLTENAKDAYREQLRISDRRRNPLDVRYAYLMPSLNVYALRAPMFVENQSLQPKKKATAERRMMTHSPLPVAVAGEIRTAEKRGWRITVIADEFSPGRLQWEIKSKELISQ